MNINQKIYLVSGLILVLIVLLFGGIVKPLILEIKTTSALVKERNEKLVVLEKTDKSYLKQLELDYNEIKDNISLIKTGLLTTDQIVDFFIDLEDMASLTLNQIEIEANEFPFFTLYLLGDFPGLMKFLGWLENSKYFIDLDFIKIKQFAEKGLSLEEEAAAIGQIKTTLGIRIYPAPKKPSSLIPKMD